MKINYSDNIVVFSILPVLFFVLGCLSFRNTEMVLYSSHSTDFFVLIAIAGAGSYLFLRKWLSVFIGIAVSLNTFLGTLFLVDIFEIKYDPFVMTAFSIALGFGVLVNTFFLLNVHQNKKGSDRTASKAIQEASKIFPAVFLSWVLLVLAIFSDLLFTANTNFKWIVILGSLTTLLNAGFLLPILSNLLLADLNEERQQDDLKPSYSEKTLNSFNQRLSNVAAKILWIMSPILYYKKIALAVFVFFIVVAGFVFEAYFDQLFVIEARKERFLQIAFLIYFFISAYRYKSYILALIPFIAIVSNYIFIAVFCSSVWNSSLLAATAFFAAMTINALGTYSYISQIINGFKEAKNLADLLLDTSAKVFEGLFASGLVMTFFLLYAIYINHPEVTGWDLFWAGIVMITGSIVVIFPVSVIVSVIFNLNQYVVKPRKKKIKSIYL